MVAIARLFFVSLAATWRGSAPAARTVASAPASVPRHSFGGKRGLEGEQSSSKTLTLGEKGKRVALGGFRKFWRERGIRVCVKLGRAINIFVVSTFDK
jgi:hypothetical protein